MMMRSIGQTRRVWQSLVASLLLALWASPALAATEEFRVLAVGIDELSTVASEKALDYGRKRGVYLATKKLGVKDPSAAAAKLTNDQLNLIIRGATVTQTRRAGKTTYEEVVVTIVTEQLRKALGLSEEVLVAASPKTRGVLALAVLTGRDRAFVWEKENTFRPSLADELLKQSHGAVMSAAGDFGDLRLIDYQNALKVKADELKPMFERYGANEIVIVILTIGPEGTLDPSTALLRRLTLRGEQTEAIEIPAETIDERTETRLNNASQRIATALSEIAASTADHDREILEKATKIGARFRYANPKELADLQAIIRGAPGVILLEQPRISLRDMQGKIYLNGDREKLQAYLVKQGVHITPMGDIWQLSLR